VCIFFRICLTLRLSLVAFLIGSCGISVSGQQPPQASKRIDAVVLELSPYGFSPSEVTHTPNAFFILIRNISGPANRTLILTNSNGRQQRQVMLTRTNPHWREILTLTPGKYTLTETNHPTWKCTISIM
jgi:hypothetical protein